MNRFEISATSLVGLMLLQRKILGDHRGYLERVFCADSLRGLLCGQEVVQINHTLTAKRGTVRGMHFQYPPHAEVKFVSCLRGEVYDVAIDLRRGSPTFLQWHAQILSAENHRTLVIPQGFAHGFQTLCDDCEMLYLHTAAYQPGSEGGINATEPLVGIQWPQPIAERSEKDAVLAMLDSNFTGVVS